jgi:Putative peptidoglycan binding domain
MIIMKKLTILLIGCSLALAGAALAQQPAEQQSPSKGKRGPEKAHATQAQPGGNAAKSQERPAKQTGAIKQPGATNERSATNERGGRNEPSAEKGQKTHAIPESKSAPEANTRSKKSTGETANEPGAGKNRKGRTEQESANAPATGTDASGREAGSTKAAKKQSMERKPGQDVNQPAAQAGTAPANPANNQQNAQANQVTAGAKGKKPAPQQVQQAKSKHANFKAQPKPQQVPSVTFNQNHRIEGSNNWQGQQYQVFRSYQPQWHDQGWYHSHYNNVVLIGGGYYFFNAGYWFPAWGYSASAQYYPYDGPIYAGHGAEPPDKVIAQTQDLLQQMGYYKGEVDGLLGPLTRDALTAYQADQGLTQTAAIDQPTLDSLGLA